MEFHVLSFEGPDAYARAGGIASRITGLTRALATAGHPTHLWFVGDPSLSGEERDGELTLHRWCQWISAYHPHGVYDGEDGKAADYAASLPPHLFEHLAPRLAAGDTAVILAEEWHTVHSVLHLDWLLRRAGLRSRASILWNANNVFGFDRVDWRALSEAAIITTVSRMMKLKMHALGVDPVVIPNGLEPEAFAVLDDAQVREFQTRLLGRSILSKVARWDPDKRWIMAVDIVHAMKQQGRAPLLIARGGMESHGEEVLGRAKALGLKIHHRAAGRGGRGLLDAVSGINGTDVLVLESHLDGEAKRLLYHASSAVLANSGFEPFGLVGLEAMAAGGVACTGCSGEDYADGGRNALVLQTSDPWEFVGFMHRLRSHPEEERVLRKQGRTTARHYAWDAVVRRNLIPRIEITRTAAAASASSVPALA